ncbi:MAG: trypsin-like peptidase domain-containing protein, partial [Actinomycetota bacterium]|nr:trypsin-like peptidase domain-containing protein [Actinomycetota bacterium]
ISQWVSGHLPQPPDAFTVLRRIVGQQTFPQVFSALHPGEAVGPAPASTGLSASLLPQVAASTVEVQGQACSRIQEGSGFAVAPDLVATNAHVVAGEPAGQTSVLLPSGQRLAAKVVLFDPNRDLALLAVGHLGEQPLPIGTGAVGTTGAVFGHPGGQERLAIIPASVAQEITATGRDLYDRHDTQRDVFVLAAGLAPGDSGGALVDSRGTVIGVAFAIAVDRPGTAYALTSRELQAALVTPRSAAAVSTASCLSS